jgi:hypothetical protein
MRDLRKNKQTITYQNPTGTVTYETDANGLKTGQRIPEYGEAQSFDINIRINRGGIWLRDYGISTEYDGIMTSTEPDLPFNEGTLVQFKGKKFVISRMDISLNETRMYLAEVK